MFYFLTVEKVLGSLGLKAIMRSVILVGSTNRTDGWRRNEGPQKSTSRQELENLGLRNFIQTLLNVLLDQTGAGAAQRSLRRLRNSAYFRKSF